MSWPSINFKPYLLVSILCLPVGKNIANELFEGCWHDFESKRVMEWSSAYPESLSHVPTNFHNNRHLTGLKKSLDKFAVELDDFDDIYQASLTIAARNCPSKRHEIGENLRRKYVVANKLYSELRYIHSLLSDVNTYRQNSRLLKKLTKKTKELKGQLKR
jgi:hypothetical protein